ncbi:hypothetical protein [Halomarina rubra]|uniref:Uncharacterized protein n=1 Tax=Halomarina rubra TaxID=2071873 RepID=A0ABD6AT02_9EURY|nr:hypothetical protein [Halomarina rubra]
MPAPPPPADPPDDADAFATALAERFEATPTERRVVARQARDLADSGRYEADTGHELTPAVVVHELADAPDERLPSKWNWWLGSLELAFGDYAEFQVRAVGRE